MNEPKRRQGWKAFLTPGWVLTAVLVLTFTYFAFTFLGPWQLNKGAQKSAFNHRLEQAIQHDPVPAADVLPKDGSSAGLEKEWTHVQLRGSFIPSAEVLLRNRPVDSSPAFQVLTPFKTDAGQTILVNRGWAPPIQGADVPELPDPPTGTVDVTGYVRMSEAEALTDPTQSQGYTQVSGIHTATIGDTVKPKLEDAHALVVTQQTPLTMEYVQLDEVSVAAMNEQDNSSAELHEIPLPQLDNGPHLSYGIQWITFGIAAPAALIWFGYSEIRERRREKAEIAEAEAGLVSAGSHQDETGTKKQVAERASAAQSGKGELHSSGGKPKTEVEEVVEENSAGVGEQSATETAERKLADRYGGTRNRFEERRSQKRGERF